ncbi:MAG: 23S rRNA (uracil(1939)-C(5))-methyltransferase RlmD, partial [Lachnospiraceae bacterium]|nr:23S rRNA (uracil(1939)-C(5))-methyltransferase RlmD [Lachnospiraceae bacterium]
MKKGQVYQGVCERIDFPNKGIVRAEDQLCVVKNALPGQTVQFRVNKIRKGKAEGILLEVLEKAPAEIEPKCSFFGMCGGCTYLALPYEDQLHIKEEQVHKLLDSVLYKQEVPYRWEGIKASPKPYEYRNKMEFSFGDEYKDGPLALGMHKRGSFHDIVTVKDCHIVDGDYRLILNEVLAFFQAKGLPYYHRMRHDGILRHLLVRKAVKTGEILIALVTTSVIASEEALLQEFKDMLLGLPLTGTVAGILHISNDSLADVVQSDTTRVLYGQEYFFEELLGLTFKVSTFSFFQTNSLGAEVLYTTAREYIGDLGQGEKVVYDLYSGTGTIAQLMAPVAKQVIGVEIVEEAVEAAKENAARNGLTNCTFLAGDVLKTLDDIEEKPDFIVLDPPRDGIHPKALAKIVNYGVEHMVYISCKPTSLVRDLEVFLEAGYRVERACAVDQFPWTANVETVVLLVREKVHDYIYVDYEPKDTDYLKDCK